MKGEINVQGEIMSFVSEKEKLIKKFNVLLIHLLARKKLKAAERNSREREAKNTFEFLWGSFIKSPSPRNSPRDLRWKNMMFYYLRNLSSSLRHEDFESRKISINFHFSSLIFPLPLPLWHSPALGAMIGLAKICFQFIFKAFDVVNLVFCSACVAST